MKHAPPQQTPEVHETVDAWHHHTSDEGMPQKEHAPRVNTLVLTFVFVAIVTVISATIGASILYFTRHVTELRQQQIETTVLAADANAYREQSEQALKEFGWADAEKGVVRLPLDIARQRVIARYSK
jgi:hypothetical protein